LKLRLQANRATAEEMLRRVRADGAYLVRPSQTDDEGLSISFRAEGKIKHCRVKKEGQSSRSSRSSLESHILSGQQWDGLEGVGLLCLCFPQKNALASVSVR
jgi:ribosomal 50S subunit-recycling heat shock protein